MVLCLKGANVAIPSTVRESLLKNNLYCMSVPWDIDHNLESKASLNSQEFGYLGIMAAQWLALFPLEHSCS